MIQAAIDQYLADKQAEYKSTNSAWRPSSLGRCYRFQFWSRNGTEPSNPLEPRVLRVFHAGNLFHDFVQGIIIKQHPEAKIEVECEGHGIKGRADLVLENEVYDIKSIHSRGFWYMDKAGYDVKKEKEPNWLQVAAYAWLLGKPSCSIIFISKDDLSIRHYSDLTEKWIPKLEQELYNLNHYWDSKELPKAEPRCYAGKECAYCGFKDLCKKVEAEKQ